MKEAEAANAQQEELRIAAQAGESALSRKLAHHRVIHQDLEKNLVQEMTILCDNAGAIAELKELREAATEVVAQIMPAEGEDTSSLAERLKEAPGRVKVLLKETAKACASGLLTTCRLLYPGVGLATVADGLPDDFTDEQVEKAQTEVEPLASKTADEMNL